jgi:peptidylprolyl isomerase
MRKVQLGDVIRIHYTGKLEDGTEFDSSTGKEPIEFKVGKGTILPGVEKGVIGMAPGETKTITISPDEAHGEIREELIARIDKKGLPSNASLSPGMPIEMKRPNGEMMTVMVVDITDDTVTLDANSPLAGRTLVFDLELVALV